MNEDDLGLMELSTVLDRQKKSENASKILGAHGSHVCN